jgi:hypothetical protein
MNKLTQTMLGVIELSLGVIAIAQFSRVAHAASPAPATMVGSNCYGQLPTIINGTLQSNIFFQAGVCFVQWSDGTRCVAASPGTTGGAAMQCAFSGVVGVP